MSSGGFPLGDPTSYTSTRTWNSGPNSINVNQTEIPKAYAPRSNLNGGSNQHPQANDYVNQTVHCARFVDESEMNLYYHLVFSYNPKDLSKKKALNSLTVGSASKRSYDQMNGTGSSGALNYLPGQGEQLLCANLMKMNSLLAKVDWDNVQDEEKLKAKFLEYFLSTDFMGICITPESVTRKRSRQSPDVRTFRIAGEAPTYDIFDPFGPFDPAPSDVIYVLMVRMVAEDKKNLLQFSVRSETGGMQMTKGSLNARVSFDGIMEVVEVAQPGHSYAHLMFYVDKHMQGPPPVFIGRDNKPRMVCGFWKIGRIREMSEQGQMNFPEAHLTFTSMDGLDYERDALRTKMVKQCKIYLNPVKGKFNWMKKKDFEVWENFVRAMVVVTRNAATGANYLLPETRLALAATGSIPFVGMTNASAIAPTATPITQSGVGGAVNTTAAAPTANPPANNTTGPTGSPGSSPSVSPVSSPPGSPTNRGSAASALQGNVVQTNVPMVVDTTGSIPARPRFLEQIGTGFRSIGRSIGLIESQTTENPVPGTGAPGVEEISVVTVKPVPEIKPSNEKTDVMDALMQRTREMSATRNEELKAIREKQKTTGNLGYETEQDWGESDTDQTKDIESGTGQTKEKAAKKVKALTDALISSKYLKLSGFPMSDLQKQNWYLFYVTDDYQGTMAKLDQFASGVIPSATTINSANAFKNSTKEISSYLVGIEEYFEENPNEPSLEIIKGGVRYDLLSDIKEEKGNETWKKARDDLIAMVAKISDKYGDFKEGKDTALADKIEKELQLTYYKLLLWETVKHVSNEAIRYMNAEFEEAFGDKGVDMTSPKMQELFNSVASFLARESGIIRMLIKGQIAKTGQLSEEADMVLTKMMTDYDLKVEEYYKIYLASKEDDGKNQEGVRFLLYRNMLIDLMVKGSISNKRFEVLKTNALIDRTRRFGAGEDLKVVDKTRIRQIPVDQLPPASRKAILQTAEKIEPGLIESAGHTRFKIKKQS